MEWIWLRDRDGRHERLSLLRYCRSPARDVGECHKPDVVGNRWPRKGRRGTRRWHVVCRHRRPSVGWARQVRPDASCTWLRWRWGSCQLAVSFLVSSSAVFGRQFVLLLWCGRRIRFRPRSRTRLFALGCPRRLRKERSAPRVRCSGTDSAAARSENKIESESLPKQRCSGYQPTTATQQGCSTATQPRPTSTRPGSRSAAAR